MQSETRPEATRRSAFLVAQLRAAIEQGALVPGQRLIEADLTQEYSVSRGPVREALARLSAEGLVDLIPNRGAVVRRPTRQELEDTMVIREALEGLSAALAARNIQQADNRTRFARFVRGARLGKLKAAEEFHLENDRLHGYLNEFAANPQLSELIERTRVRSFPKRFGSGLGDPEYRLASSGEHLQIAEAVLAGDETAARRTMGRHLSNARLRLLRALPEDKEPAPGRRA